jgi:uncharacterized protein
MRRPSEILGVTQHRPWELPPGPWMMMQEWRDLLFLHWPVDATALRSLVPAPLSIDTFDGQAWLGITPFDLRLRPRGLPVVAHFPELNCRTYVVYGGKRGVFFFSLDAMSHTAVFGARAFFLLPYYYARMSTRKVGHRIAYCARRNQGNAAFRGEYYATAQARETISGSLEHWLTERYCLYVHAGKQILRSEIHHKPWPLQDAACEIAENTIASSCGLVLPDVHPLCHFAGELDVLVWRLRRCAE